ncbi:MAG: glutamine-hydrolyzing GMP synthase [Deltaproteobacteria bacterium]|jgi:GMP synthase (glutamine-hydrolysing)|nr:glutamine-hydrolyzing GMP synthase [Deltaproteobacteria bacterium]
MSNHILIVDYGSQLTQLIARKTRAAGFFAEIMPYGLNPEPYLDKKPGALILSGGPASALTPNSPKLDPLLVKASLPTLGICYGMQLMALSFGGKLTNEAFGEYGPAQFTPLGNCQLFNLKNKGPFQVWMSHGDRVLTVPSGFKITGKTPELEIAAMGDEKRALYAIQFHPEVHHTNFGEEILKNFFKIAKLKPNWQISSFASQAIKNIERLTAPDKRVLLAYSGGVDSTVVAALLSSVLGNRLYCVFVDNGLLRLNEAEQVTQAFRSAYPKVNFKLVKAGKIFLSKLKDVVNSERKRKIIGKTFIDVFAREAKKIGPVHFLAQGTLYPDVIESVSPHGPSAKIKSHHNVGGLPKHLPFPLIEPLRDLFKDEVRILGQQLGVPDSLLWRQPFPGPGLAIRISGKVTESALKILKKADAVVREEFKNFSLEKEIWQAFAILLDARSVGVMGDGRSYGKAAVVRAVTSVDAMTADWARLPQELLSKISGRIINEVPGINRVLYDISTKPPATIEWE